MTRVLINDFHKQLSLGIKAFSPNLVLLPEQVVDKEFLGHICTAMMLNEIEIISWCFILYTILSNYQAVEAHIGDAASNIVKFNNPEELVIACAIFAKVREFV